MDWAETVLLGTLEMLGEGELQRFKDKLSEIQPKEGYQHLPSESLRNADPSALTDLLLLFYGTDYGAVVAVEVLRTIGQGALTERLERLICALREEKHYFKWQLQQHQFAKGSFMYEKCTLNDEQYRTIRAEKTSQEKMRKLYEMVPSWDKWQKDWLYQALKETNRDLVEELEGGHFVDRHREKLIQRVSEVDRVLKLLRGHTLTPEQYQSIRTRRSNVEKMQKLYELVPSWRRDQKDRLYRVLCITNGAIADECAGASTPAQEPSTSTRPGATREHFVERHREQLIQRASSVDKTLRVLKWDHDMRFEKLPYPVWYAPYESRIAELQGLSIYMAVPHHQNFTKELTSASGFTSEETESDSSSAAGTKAAGGIICQPTLLTSTGSVAVAAGETNRSQSPTACLRGQHKCNWCAREEDLPEEIKPEIIPDLDRNQETYRVHFSRAGWFCCPETELEFEVRAAVTIQYGYSSWRQHLTESQENQWMVAGPLFDIRVEPTEAVAAVHLPHFLCLRDADNSQMQIAHFINERMTLENPTRVRSFHAVLENPSFSPIGVFWRRENSDQRIQLHSIVLLYQAQRRVNLTLHLYLIPDDGSRVKAVKDYEKECQSWFVSKSHFTAKPLHFGSLYIVSSPSKITVTPKELPFLDKPAEAFQPFTEIHTTDVKKELELSLVEKNDGNPIWEAVIRPEDLAPSVSSIKMQIDTHFVDQHREQLIKRVTAVDSILDSLHGLVLDTEQYQSVRAERTNPDKMRKLYELVPSWNTGCKEKLYQALKDKHRHLVEQLEEK